MKKYFDFDKMILHHYPPHTCGVAFMIECYKHESSMFPEKLMTLNELVGTNYNMWNPNVEEWNDRKEKFIEYTNNELDVEKVLNGDFVDTDISKYFCQKYNDSKAN